MIIVNVAWNNCFRNFFNACWRESAKPLLYYCNTMSASPLIDQRKILFYKKTICWSNVVLRTVCSLYVNDIQRLSSAYNILLWHMSYIDVKRTFWSFFYFIPVNLVCSLCLFLLCVSACAAFWRNKDWLIDIAFWQLAQSAVDGSELAFSQKWWRPDLHTKRRPQRCADSFQRSAIISAYMHTSPSSCRPSRL